MKSIVLASGAGTRLYPATRAISRQLLPVYDKPMIYYPLSVLMLAAIRDVLVISTPDDLPAFQRLLGDWSQWGIHLSYAEQQRAEGLAQAFLIGREFIGTEPVCLILGDNIFYGYGFSAMLLRAAALQAGALVFGYRVQDPERYGVLAFDEDGRVTSIEEKPLRPKSSYAVTGLYSFDHQVVELAETLRPLARGELEITDLNRRYLEQGELRVELLGRGMAWLDTGTHDNLLQAANYVATIEEQQGLQVGCLEEVAFRQGWIDAQALKALGTSMATNGYGQCLLRVAAEQAE